LIFHISPLCLPFPCPLFYIPPPLPNGHQPMPHSLQESAPHERTSWTIPTAFMFTCTCSYEPTCRPELNVFVWELHGAERYNETYLIFQVSRHAQWELGGSRGWLIPHPHPLPDTCTYECTLEHSDVNNLIKQPPIWLQNENLSHVHKGRLLCFKSRGRI
jgi:hypothetical protein